MLKSILTPALIAVLLTGTAYAGQPAQNTQSAALAGVQPGEYTAAELQYILDAQRAGDWGRADYFLSHTNREQADAGSRLAVGQSAAAAGVASGEYTRFEVANIVSARESGNLTTLDFYLSHENRKPAAPASAVSPTEARIAKALGLDPTQYTLAELVALDPSNSSDD
ncbi:MAG: hypothetical protein ABI459_00840 [Deltaproteobacteria bacterium]